jgi:hypothetical protein
VLSHRRACLSGNGDSDVSVFGVVKVEEVFVVVSIQ